ncbi:hypothetical protein SAMN02927900_02069 [Rhizobium mongolense subsp. loessense]|uniref:Uncharacterized protein n=1 Tax=Rhizobium mongolense subsp. loessense TaxID=158890 RepID=A0A1G4QZJ1_9HYPH|nr:hypothetical protein SAMN02927900_02069 [Rhizobium mongolense subsp. loessense]
MPVADARAGRRRNGGPDKRLVRHDRRRAGVDRLFVRARPAGALPETGLPRTDFGDCVRPAFDLVCNSKQECSAFGAGRVDLADTPEAGCDANASVPSTHSQAIRCLPFGLHVIIGSPTARSSLAGSHLDWRGKSRPRKATVAKAAVAADRDARIKHSGHHHFRNWSRRVAFRPCIFPRRPSACSIRHTRC